MTSPSFTLLTLSNTALYLYLGRNAKITRVEIRAFYMVFPDVYNPRKISLAVDIDGITVGGGNAIVVQSMTNTDTVDVPGTIDQVAALARAGSELVRITVNSEEAARAVPAIREGLDARGVSVPLVGDFHFNGHRLLNGYPECAQALAKYRINPGNVGKGN